MQEPQQHVAPWLCQQLKEQGEVEAERVALQEAFQEVVLEV